MAQQGILSLTINDKPSLYSAYMPFVNGGGLFVQSTKRFNLGDEVFLLLTLMDLEERLPIPGKVVWITPPGSQGNRRPGIGVQFADTPDGAHARTIIESHLANLMKSDKKTYTM
ncbi:pilus assembly protein PilZ [Marinihelvus fidelis]|uniref:Pilus assembly protein PilZ n=1 Tax=Marinihelvus fidelis TaxID=2613842 RepID=A0A5N0TDT8_9GAMM|nr:PilZ domain-containing protein [Marinihelvus fidelis]KAA9132006.1 pilus assembly protein PilZ [Marinihelvus fidelis]